MKKSKKIKIWTFSALGVIILCVVLFNKIQYPIRLEKFNNTEFKGKLTYIYSGSSGTRIGLNDNLEKIPVFSEYNDSIGSFFYRFVIIGDSIYKERNDRYIHVFRGKSEYLFETIRK
jgi:hypothetical protein